MIRGKFTIDKETGRAVPYHEQRKERTTAVITDEMEPTKHMGDCRYYTSKAKFRATTRAMGFEEVGNDWDKDPPRVIDPDYDRKLQEDTERTFYALRDGEIEVSEYTKERCKLIDHNLEHYNYDNRERDDDGNA